jgi:F-type H+-transporting ATPase subunit a
VPKRRVLGCSFPFFILAIIIVLLLFIISLLAGPIGQGFLRAIGISINFPDWFNVPQPSPKLPPEVIFHLFGFPITNTIIAAWFTIVVLVGFSFAVTHRLKLIPSRLQSALEFALETLLKFCQSVAGEKNGRRFFPVVTTIFLFVIINAWLSLVPGFGSITVHTAEREVHLLRGANTDINMPLALAFISFVFVEYFGLKEGGFRYLSKFVNVGLFFRSLGEIAKGKRAGFMDLITGFINIFVGLLEALSELVRIVSFTFRLFGNMTAGEILLLIAAFLIPWIFALPFYGLELLVGFVQALIFGGLTLVFLTVATAGHGHEPT